MHSSWGMDVFYVFKYLYIIWGNANQKGPGWRLARTSRSTHISIGHKVTFDSDCHIYIVVWVPTIQDFLAFRGTYSIHVRMSLIYLLFIYLLLIKSKLTQINIDYANIRSTQNLHEMTLPLSWIKCNFFISFYESSWADVLKHFFCSERGFNFIYTWLLISLTQYSDQLNEIRLPFYRV